LLFILFFAFPRNIDDASYLWEDILTDHPLDMLALRFAHDTYFYRGQQYEMRDSIARVLPYWRADMPLYGFLMGMHSFGLVETNLYPEAERVARKVRFSDEFNIPTTLALTIMVNGL
jgi:hypothetical protein